MKEFYQKYKDNLALVIVIEDEDFEKNAEALKATGFEWTVLRGMSRREVYESFNVRIMQHIFLLTHRQARWFTGSLAR
jgi:stalled ribosome rescue protein Dom34